MKTITCLLIGLSATLSMVQAQESNQLPAAQAQALPAAQAQALPAAQVTLPYAELSRILALANQAKPEASPAPPVGAALKTAHFKVSAQSPQGPLQAEAEFDAINLSGKWEWTPLIRGLQVERIAPAEASVVTRGGIAGLMHREVGNHHVKLSMSGSSLSFTAAEATSRILELADAPQGHAWQIEGGAKRISNQRYSLGNNEVTISLKPLITEVASTWSLTSELVIDAETSKINAIGRISLSANEGTGQTAQIKLPAEATQIHVKGSDLVDWKLHHDSRGQWLQLRWKTARILNRSIELVYTLPTPPADKPLRVQAPALENGESQAVVALAAAEGIEATNPANQKAAGNLPPWIQALSRSADMVAQRGSGPFEFTLRYLPRAKTADATIRVASFDMQVVADGSLLCTAEFEIHHREWTQWEFTLPEKGVLLSCQRNAQATEPIISGKKLLSLQLPPGEEGSNNITRVRLMFTSKTGSMDPVQGALTLKLPTTPLFIQQTEWIVRIPDTYKVQAIEGNVQIKPTKEASEGIALTKSFNHGDEAVAQLYYRKQGLDD